MAKSSIVVLALLLSLASGFIPRQPALVPKQPTTTTSELQAAPTMVIYWTIKVRLILAPAFERSPNVPIGICCRKYFLNRRWFVPRCRCRPFAKYLNSFHKHAVNNLRLLFSDTMVVRDRLCRLRGGTNRWVEGYRRLVWTLHQAWWRRWWRQTSARRQKGSQIFVKNKNCTRSPVFWASVYDDFGSFIRKEILTDAVQLKVKQSTAWQEWRSGQRMIN